MTAALPPEEQLNPDHPANDYPGDFGALCDQPVDDVETPELEDMDQEPAVDDEPTETPDGELAPADDDEEAN